MYKKTAIAVAGALFVLFGLPLGYHLRRYGIGGAMAAAVGIFILYWALLVQGEKLADRGLLVPWLGMWMANILLIPATLWAWWRYVRPKH
jgi:lipopolysaccharide export system permease protein